MIEHDNIELAKQCKKISQQSSGIKATNVNGWHSEPYFMDTCYNESLKTLATKVLSASEDICQYLNVRPNLNLKMKEFWINVNPTGSRNKMHDHPASVFSAVYYVQANDNSGDIGFGNPSQMTEFWWRSIVDQRHHNTLIVKYKPITGKLIVFPSWLVHFVEPNKHKSDRISIAFNMAF
jgi:uncharacterized protein (TIGR02466 family)